MVLASKWDRVSVALIPALCRYRNAKSTKIGSLLPTRLFVAIKKCRYVFDILITQWRRHAIHDGIFAGTVSKGV